MKQCLVSDQIINNKLLVTSAYTSWLLNSNIYFIVYSLNWYDIHMTDFKVFGSWNVSRVQISFEMHHVEKLS